MMIKAVPHFAGLAILALAISVHGASTRVSRTDPAVKACQLLQASFPQLVSFPGSEQYESDIEHWSSTSTQNATCSIEPATADDVSSIMEIIGRDDIRAPFAIKCGGHAFNNGSSSTTGVQISMAKFTELTYDAESSTVTIGMGLTWDQVYSQLEPLGVMVAGGRINGVGNSPGVGGLSLGGGYSWKTNQFGLTIDTIVSHNLVLPSGQQVQVSNASYPDLFFGLKGGLNNFGVVTNITYEAHPQTLVFGGAISYDLNVTDSVNAAISNFSVNNTDPKAQLLVTYLSTSGQFTASVVPFYDAPTPPAGIFDAFLAIPSTSSAVKTRTFVDFMTTFGDGDLGIGAFGLAENVVPITHYPVALLGEMVQQVISLGDKLTAANNGTIVIVSMTPEPFTNPFAHSRGGAYPHPPSRQVTPATPEIAYQFNPNLTSAAQAAFHDSIVSTTKEFSYNIQAEAVAEGVSSWDDILYPNYAIAGTPIELMYGSNVQQLKEISSKYDPNGIMNLTGGVHF